MAKPQEYLPLSWQDYHHLAEKLGQKVFHGSPKLDRIIGISRCGLTLGHILSDLLQLPVTIFTIKSYADIKKQSQIKVTEKLPISIAGENILLVDGIADTGHTLFKALDYLRSLGPASITTATLYYKPHSDYRPDYFVKTTSQWILLPYEFIEYGCSFVRKLQRQGKSRLVINRFLKQLSYTDLQIKHLWKIYEQKRPTLIKE
jgi:hypoxanthine phosphoribosyltransferase